MYGKEAISLRENSIVATVLLERVDKVGNKEALNSRKQKNILEMRNNPNMTTAEFHAILGVSETEGEKTLSFIKENG